MAGYTFFDPKEKGRIQSAPFSFGVACALPEAMPEQMRNGAFVAVKAAEMGTTDRGGEADQQRGRSEEAGNQGVASRFFGGLPCLVFELLHVLHGRIHPAL